jgi:TRAP transporter TAXI family solute receptor
MGSPWASLVGADIGVPISVEATGGSSINIQMVDSRKADIGYTASDLTYQAWEGLDWSKDKKLRNQRALMVHGANVLHIYAVRRSGFKSLSDLNGRSINPSRRRSGTDLVIRDMVEVLGIKPSRITNANPSDANGHLADGRLDMAAVLGTPPHPAVSEFEASNDMVLIALTDSERQVFLKKQPALAAYEIPANFYKGQTAPVSTVAAFIVTILRSDLPESLAYALVKQTFAKKETLAGAHKSFAQLEAKSILNSMIPVHAGAVKFYEEIGVKIPAKLQATN